MVALGVIVATATMSLVYFNHAPEPFSFNVKLVGVSLVAFLTVFAGVGVERLSTLKLESRKQLELETLAAKKAIIADDMTDLPDSIAYIVYWPREDNSADFHHIFARPGMERSFTDILKINSQQINRLESQKLPVHDIKRLDSEFSHMLMANVTLYKYIGHQFTYRNKRYEIGLDLTGYHRTGHLASVKLIKQVLISSFAIIIVFPIFFRINLLVPLRRLLEGVKQTNDGQLDVNIPVQFEDEIGFLTQSFNDMVQTLNNSNLQKDELNQALKKINAELELRVAERTAELNEANNELEARVEKRTAELAKAKEEAEVANLAKNNFLASVSHELRTPLHHILGFSQILQGKGLETQDEKQRTYFTNIIKAGKHLLSLIDDVLDLSQADLGKMVLNPGEVDLKKLLENSMTPIREKDLKSGLSVELIFPKSMEGTTIIADELKLKQIMFNLLSNAVKFTPDEGSIRVEVEKKEREVVICVSDSGIGIPAELKDSIFQNFFQVQNNISGKTPGVGLGLSISRRLAELHGGRLWVSSFGEGKGSRFYFSLPIRGILE